MKSNKIYIFLGFSLVIVVITLSILTFSINNNYETTSVTKEDIEKIEKYVELYPENTDSLMYLARAYSKKGLYEKVIPVYKKMITLEPENDQYTYRLSIAYIENKQYELGLEQLNYTDKLNPSHPTTLLLMSQINLLLGNYSEANLLALKSLKSAEEMMDNPSHYKKWRDISSNFNETNVHVWIDTIEILSLDSLKILAIENAMKLSVNMKEEEKEYLLDQLEFLKKD
ncbi:Anaphase-promoting complex, cyclosome, subunit 3 [Paraliobacillus sp. PM-2]|uniref:tetratricopeptide repeat protein n=1 Tax=Paraliobacillus sp. PM-2 TaxID=1462524 RepID=UPI00061C4567|nr:CDC27 family protein [Paraliobacillus sp. PM-2]CQR46049.1 Anaphase-promoting complex, cyclosome, subunit 3 [Paraliobacillus sp. PM-2]